MARQHPYAPWRRLILVPCWIIQILFPGFTLGLAAVGISLILRNDSDDNVDESYDGSLRANLAIGWIYIIFSALCIILTITEIVSILRRKLRPLIFLTTNVFKSTCWTALFILGFWDRFRVSQKTLPNILSLVVNIILLLAFYIPLAHGAIIFHRNRKASKYEPVNPKHASYNSTSEPVPEAFPHAYKSFTTIEQTTDLEANDRTTGRPRRLSYNHKRDTRFDSYKQTRRSFSDSNVVGSVAGKPTEAPFSVRSRSSYGDEQAVGDEMIGTEDLLSWRLGTLAICLVLYQGVWIDGLEFYFFVHIDWLQLSSTSIGGLRKTTAFSEVR
ncbi:hypothetical protein EYC80_001099 [Monilinia laxa]|uniref:Uncharacterized protein n=1 Tax=Monilinia laxa TaxID=61186 RepID=A0A5N6K828_MONLA|nr:hypothetical protein EYC80_001099 [Monilinia laxa]